MQSFCQSDCSIMLINSTFSESEFISFSVGNKKSLKSHCRKSLRRKENKIHYIQRVREKRKAQVYKVDDTMRQFCNVKKPLRIFWQHSFTISLYCFAKSCATSYYPRMILKPLFIAVNHIKVHNLQHQSKTLYTVRALWSYKFELQPAEFYEFSTSLWTK